MNNKLKERLDAMSKKANVDAQFPDYSISSNEMDLFVELRASYASGNLVTRSEMEEAVAKAVAEEREACANVMGEITKPTLPPFNLSDRECDAFDEGQKAAYKAFVRKVRARSEKKESE